MLPDAEQKLVVEVPDSAAQLDAMLDASPGDYANIAAVTTTVDGSLSPSAPVHVFVNPQMWAGLKPHGAQVVLSHEAVHVVKGAAITSRSEERRVGKECVGTCSSRGSPEH